MGSEGLELTDRKISIAVGFGSGRPRQRFCSPGADILVGGHRQKYIRSQVVWSLWGKIQQGKRIRSAGAGGGCARQGREQG